MRRSFKIILAAAIICNLLAVSQCQKLPTQYAESSRTMIRGITLADWTATGYSQPSSQEAISTIALTGATHLIIIVTAYQENRTSNEVRADPVLTPNLASVEKAAECAGSAGMKVIIKPHILSNDGTWAGKITPNDPSAWFKSYNNFLRPLAELAQALGAVQFVIGTELASTLQYEQNWQETIQNIKSIFKGELVYAASWDEAAKVPFWQELDYVGVDFYFPVSSRKDPGRFEILSGWQPWLKRLQLLHKQSGHDIILTEIGYRSIDGAGMQPHRFDNPGVIDLDEQADLYWAALQAIEEVPWISGIMWWNWLAADSSGGPQDKDYTPFGKPAQIELTQSWNGQK